MKSVCHHFFPPRWLNAEEKQSFDSHRSYLLKVYSITINIIFTARLAKDTIGDPIKHFWKEKNDSTIYFYEGFRVICMQLFPPSTAWHCKLWFWSQMALNSVPKWERFHRLKNRFRACFVLWLRMISGYSLSTSHSIKWDNLL